MVGQASAAAPGRAIVQDGTVKTAGGDLLRGTHAHIGNEVTAEICNYYVNLDNVIELRDQAHLNAIRISALRWSNNPMPLNEVLGYIDAVVDNCEAAGIYAIVNFHGTNLTNGSWDWTSFWQQAAPRYKDRTHVIYNLINELMQCGCPTCYLPTSLNDFPPGWIVSVGQIKAVYDIVRAAAPNTMIWGVEPVNIQCDWGQWLVDYYGPALGIDWSAGKDAFTFHTYGTDPDLIRATRSHGVPIVNSEYSYPQEWSSGYAPIEGYEYMSEFMERNGISHFYWPQFQNRNADQNSGLLTLLVPDAIAKGYVWWSDDTTPPTMAPGGLSGEALSDTGIRLTWDPLPAQADLESSIRKYAVYQDGVKVSEVTGTTAELSGLREATEYEFAVAGVNQANLEGPRATVSASTLPDTQAPLLTFAYAVDQNTVAVCFSEPVDQTSGQTPSNYTLSGGIVVSSVTLDADGVRADLQVTPLQNGSEVTLTVGGVKDRARTPNLCIGTATFTYPAATGVYYRTYEIDYACGLPEPAELEALSPAKEGVQQGFFIGAASVTRTDDFAMLLTSHLLVTEAGTYMFHLAADEGAALYVNGEMLIDNGGCHTREERGAGTTLSPGVYPITVVYADDIGTQTLALQYTAPGRTKQPIPLSQLLLLENGQTAGVQHTGRTNTPTVPMVRPLSVGSRVVNLTVPQGADGPVRVRVVAFDARGSSVGVLCDRMTGPGACRISIPNELGPGSFVFRVNIGSTETVLPVAVLR